MVEGRAQGLLEVWLQRAIIGLAAAVLLAFFHRQLCVQPITFDPHCKMSLVPMALRQGDLQKIRTHKLDAILSLRWRRHCVWKATKRNNKVVACYSVDERTVGSSCCGWVCPLIIVSSDKDKPALKLDLSRRGQSRSGVGSWPASPVIGNCSELCLKLILLPTHWGKLHQAGKACCVINGKMGHWSFVSSPSPGERER